MVGIGKSKKIIFTVGVVVLAAGVAFGGYFFGYNKGLTQTKKVEISGVVNIGSNEAPKDFSVFWEAWQKLKDLHADALKTSDQDLLYGALRGLAGSFKDPNTNFFPPSDARKFEEDVNGSFGGIGANIGQDNDVITVIAPLKGTPSEKAGLKSGDLILKINNEPTNGLDVNEAVKKIRGPVGTNVVLTIFRKEWAQPRDISITRETIIIPTLDFSLKDDNQIADLQLYGFNENAPLLFYKAAYGILTTGVKGVILDLRDDPGGFLEVATDLAGYFVPRGQIIVSERYRSGPDRVFRATGNEGLKNLPVVVLINRGSASASEILAGTLRDLRGAKLVGERSFGKGTVQEVENLKDGSSLKITVAHWVMPKGKLLDKDGIKPDYEVVLTDDDIKNKRDPQLDKALEVLRAEIAKAGITGTSFTPGLTSPPPAAVGIEGINGGTIIITPKKQ